MELQPRPSFCENSKASPGHISFIPTFLKNSIKIEIHLISVAGLLQHNQLIVDIKLPAGMVLMTDLFLGFQIADAVYSQSNVFARGLTLYTQQMLSNMGHFTSNGALSLTSN